MTVSTEIILHSYFPGSDMAEEPIPFQFLDADHVSVSIVGASGLLVAGTDYVITGNGRTLAASIRALRAFAEDQEVRLLRDTALRQDAVTDPFKPLPAEQVGRELDRRALIEQELRQKVDRAPKTPIGGGSEGKFPVVLPDGGWGWSVGTGNDPALREDLANPDGSGATNLTFKQDGPNARTELLSDALRRFVWVDQFKLAIDADDTQSIIRAIPAASRLMFRDRDYMVSGPIIVPGLKFLIGDLVGCTRIVQTNMTSDLLRFVMAFAQAGGLSHITLTSDVDAFGARGSTGVALTIDNPNDNFVCSDFEVVSYDKQILVKGAYQPHFRDFRCLFFTDYAVKLEAYAPGYEIAGSQWQSGKISNLGFAENGYDSIGIWGRQASGEFFRDIDIPMVGRGVVLDPPANSWARFVRFANVLADSCYYEGWTLDGGAGGYVIDIECLGCWSAGSGGGAYRPAGSDRGAGLLIKGIAIDDVRWALGTLRDNDCGGADLQGGTNIRFTGTSIARNSRRLGFNNIYPGVRVRAGVSSWGIHNSVIGNFAQGVFDIQQAESVVIDVGASTNFAITDSDLSNPGPGKQPFVNGSTSSNYVLSGNRPRRAVGLNASERQVLTNLCGAAIAAGTFAYIGPNGIATDAFSSVHIMQHPGVLAKVKISVPAAPGAGQSYTYTIYLNGAPTGMTGTIAESALTTELAAAFLFSEGDLVCTRVAATAGATPVQHNIALVVEP
ncbi:hypothetical protein ACKU27_11100 [Sphingobium yanoikuyae]|uniref:hypothetical protein n=1 Tax=Sphingobium yanoikuyae TaxID=13690 RepID=UPI003B921E21